MFRHRAIGAIVVCLLLLIQPVSTGVGCTVLCMTAAGAGATTLTVITGSILPTFLVGLGAEKAVSSAWEECKRLCK